MQMQTLGQTVAFRKCPEEESLVTVIAHLAQETGLNLPDGSRIVIKPNLNDLRGPYSGFTTDVRVVRALVEYLTSRCNPKEILIVESNSWNRLAEEAFDRLGYREIESSNEKVKLVNLTKIPSVTVQSPFPTQYNRLRIPRLFMEADFFITVAKLRTHHTIISGALKNQFGCVPGRYKGRYHPYLNDVLSTLNLLIKPDWCLIDGLIGRDVGPREVGLLIASRDPVAVDSVSARVMGFNPGKIPHIATAARRGIGQMDGITVLYNGDKCTDLSSIISPKFVGQIGLSISITSLVWILLRKGDSMKNLAYRLQQYASLLAGAGAYSKTELLRRVLDFKKLQTTLKGLRMRKAQDEI